MIRTLLPYLKPYRRQAILGPLSIILEVILEINIPILMSRIVDVGIPNKDLSTVIITGLFMILMALCGMGAGVLSSKFSSEAGAGFASCLRGALFNRVQEFSFSNTDKFTTASLITRLTTDVTNTQNALITIIRMLMRSPVMLIGATFMAFSIDGELALIFLVAIPILAAAIFIISKMAFSRFEKMLRQYDNLNTIVQENLISIRIVKAFVRSDYEKGKFKNVNDMLMAASIKAEKVIIWNMPIMNLTVYSCIIAVLWFGGNKIIEGSMFSGALISFINYVTQILMILMMIGMALTQLVLSRASVSRIAAVLTEEPDIEGADEENSPQVEDGSIQFRHVHFRYATNSDDILSDINLSIRSGETIGIIGGTGSSKTSLVQLIPRLYDVTAGTLLVGGRDVKEYGLKTLRSQVAMVLQKNVLFTGTIRDNLRWGNANATQEEIEEACKAASAHDFIMSFPDGYDTMLGQGGVNVSGGQKQRLCIARALLCRPKILILDDSTSAVDTATDASIREALRHSLAGTTKLIIAQRITSVADADRIVVLENGRIDGVGTHEELLKTNEIYRDVYTSQQKGVE